MPKILITGNGFDLFHHLPTKYGHFIAVMKTIEEFDFTNQITFKDLFGENFRKSFENDGILLAENYDVSKVKFNNEDIKKLKELISKNSWYNHFRRISNLETWIDFEVEIENALSQISTIVKYTEKSPAGNKNFQHRELNVYIDFNCFGFCGRLSNEYSYLEDAYINKRTSKLDAKKILNSMAKSFDEFVSIFNSYLSNIVFNFYDSFKGKSKIPVSEIDFFFSFNYTPTIETIYNKNIVVTYLHGQANQNYLIQNIVLGVNEISAEITANKVFEFSKDYQKVVKETNNNLLELPTKETSIIEEVRFYIFGHSLDKSDKEYIEHIFKFLEADTSGMSEIVVFYYDLNDKKNKVKNLFSFINKKAVISFDSCGRLKFVEINEQNLKHEFNRKLWQKEFYV